jgi:hypothetical protein
MTEISPYYAEVFEFEHFRLFLCPRSVFDPLHPLPGRAWKIRSAGFGQAL